MRNNRIGPASTILFDAGNTLAFLDLPRVERLLGELGIAATPGAVERAEASARAAMIGYAAAEPSRTDRERWTIYVGAMVRALGHPEESALEGLRAALEAAHRRDNLWRRVEPGTGAVLDRLRARGFRLGVVSNADGRVRALLGELGLAHRFETIVDSHEVGVEKPDPRIFEIALRQMGERADRAVYVGDLPPVDVVGAARAGIAPVLLDPLGIADDVGCPVIARLEQLEELVDGP